MSASDIVRDWERCVRHDLLPQLHGHQAKALAHFSFAMALTHHCHSGRLAANVPTPATAASAQRRWERLLANPRWQPTRVMQDLGAAVLRPWAGRPLLLLLDETPKANDLRCLKLCVAYRQRALPLASSCYRPHRLPRPLPQLVRGLLRAARRQLPPGSDVTLLADRGLAWPLLVDWCVEHGWHYVLRLQSDTRVQVEGQPEQRVADLVGRPGRRWLGPARAFKKAGWRDGEVVATWERGCREPWLLLTDRPASLRHCRTYGKRMWVEEGFRDEKSQGFHWEKSRVVDPVHAHRLLVVLALAMLLAVSVGTELVKRGRRGELDTRRRRRLSMVQLGLRWLRYVLTHGRGSLRLDRVFLYP
jgi:hypothetical protein